MKKKQKSELSKEPRSGRLPDGSLRFILVLPKDLADLFEVEMEEQDRKKLPLARFIIKRYFKIKLQGFLKTQEAFSHSIDDKPENLEEVAGH